MPGPRFGVTLIGIKTRQKPVSFDELEEYAYAQVASRGGCGRHFRSSCRRNGSGADRDQVQSRGRAEYAEGQGRREVQGTRREIHQRQGQGRSLSKLDALQGQGRAGGAAARRGANAGAVELQVRPDGHQGLRGVRPALPAAEPGGAAQGHRRSDRQEACSSCWSRKA